MTEGSPLVQTDLRWQMDISQASKHVRRSCEDLAHELKPLYQSKIILWSRVDGLILFFEDQ